MALQAEVHIQLAPRQVATLEALPRPLFLVPLSLVRIPPVVLRLGPSLALVALAAQGKAVPPQTPLPLVRLAPSVAPQLRVQVWALQLNEKSKLKQNSTNLWLQPSFDDDEGGHCMQSAAQSLIEFQRSGEGHRTY